MGSAGENIPTYVTALKKVALEIRCKSFCLVKVLNN